MNSSCLVQFLVWQVYSAVLAMTGRPGEEYSVLAVNTVTSGDKKLLNITRVQRCWFEQFILRANILTQKLPYFQKNHPSSSVGEQLTSIYLYLDQCPFKGCPK